VVAFSADGQRLASGSSDNTVKIWNTVTGKELLNLKGLFSIRSFSAGSTAGVAFKGVLPNRINKVAFSPDGQRLVAADDRGVVVWESSVPPEVQDRRAAYQLVVDLFRQRGLRADVLEWLRTLPGTSPSRRQEAITVAQTYPENPEVLNQLAWKLVKLPGGEMSGYRKALRYSEEACQFEPDAYLTTLGVAHYRVGNDDKALETLLRADKINQKQEKGSIPADLAFLAMTQQHLGHAKEAQAELQRLRERMKEPDWAQNAEAQGFLREAEALLAKPKTPGDK
jgi:tetratricopeptide (TPR) repeat protein